MTMVGVMPSHRRRGILTQLMRRQLDETLAVAGSHSRSSAPPRSSIYGRFGYGVTSLKTA